MKENLQEIIEKLEDNIFKINYADSEKASRRLIKQLGNNISKYKQHLVQGGVYDEYLDQYDSYSRWRG